MLSTGRPFARDGWMDSSRLLKVGGRGFTALSALERFPGSRFLVRFPFSVPTVQTRTANVEPRTENREPRTWNLEPRTAEMLEPEVNREISGPSSEFDLVTQETFV